MNAILESPIEALAFNYSSFGFFTVVNIVWTWVAVVTAAVGFWRIKAFSMLPGQEPRENFSGDRTPSPGQQMLVTSSSSSSSSQVERLLSTQQVLSMSKESTSSTSASTMMSVDAASLKGTKGKLTLYFKQDEGGEYNRDEYGDQEGEDDGVELSKEWFENWERLLKLRKGERGWYCYQDMKIIDGSVVRLWEGSTRRREAEKTAFSVGVVCLW